MCIVTNQETKTIHFEIGRTVRAKKRYSEAVWIIGVLGLGAACIWFAADLIKLFSDYPKVKWGSIVPQRHHQLKTDSSQKLPILLRAITENTVQMGPALSEDALLEIGLYRKCSQNRIEIPAVLFCLHNSKFAQFQRILLGITFSN